MGYPTISDAFGKAIITSGSTLLTPGWDSLVPPRTEGIISFVLIFTIGYQLEQ
jgi:hypothetical protein